jgi:hypothetical protein
LQRRREALLVESELNRQALRLEVMQINLTIDRLRHGWVSGQTIWKLAAPIVGFLIARRFSRSGAGRSANASSVFSIGRGLWNSWQEWRRSSSKK